MPMPMPGSPPPMPPQMAQAPGGLGPVTMPQGNQGNMAAAITEVRNAMTMLQKALPMVPMGSPIHNDILSFVKKIGEHLTKGEDNQGLQLQSLLQMVKQSAQSAPQNAMQRMFPAQQPNTPPAMPPAGGAPGGGE